MLDKFDCDFEAYADDIKIFKNINSEQDVCNLQKNIDNCEMWCTENGLSLNAKKCVVLSITRRRNVEQTILLSGRQLDFVYEIRDLEVLVDSHLKFNNHIEAIVRKANQMLGFLTRTCQKFTNLKTILCLYKAIVRPHLEYCSSVWSPIYNIYADKVESVQHRFTRYVYKKFHYLMEEYQTRLQRLELQSLYDRRMQASATVLHKIVNFNLQTSLASQIQYRFNTHNLRTIRTFAFGIPTTNLGKAAPLFRMCTDYEENFSNVDIFNSNIDTFKGQIKQVMSA